ncbi:ribonuclease III [[Emmonsia] crescens]|uniref:Ribonuclease III n=1 Tax=[Emmonsia] crescens TaxID=73230 RepID=A0A2B7Z7T5_9EURO|nr:ribonuclease III [Emmonsia crescens]
MDTKRKLEENCGAMTTGKSVKRRKKLRDPQPDSVSTSSQTSSGNLNCTTKIQSRLDKLRKLTRKLLSHPEQVQEAVNGSGPDVVVALAELGKAFSPKKSTPDSLYYSQSPRNRLHSSSLQLHAHNTVPPLPPVLDKQLQTAMLTHEGLNNPNTSSSPERNYERMELLGDAYIEIMATRLVWDTFPRLSAGRLSQIRELLVKNETLAEYATLYGLDQKLLVPPDIRNQAKTWTKVKGDLFEAYVAAVILSNRENGVQLVEDWLTQLWIPKLEQIEKDKPVLRYKEELAKLIMDKGVRVSYMDEKKSISHPGGLQTFFIGVYLTGWGHKNECLGSGTGLSKVIAGNEAARKALENPITHRAAAAKQAFHAAKSEGEASAAPPS